MFFLFVVFEGENVDVCPCEFSELMLFSNLSLSLPKSFLAPLHFRYLKSKLTIFLALKQPGHQNNATERDETNLSLEASDRVVEVEDADRCIESGLVSSQTSSVPLSAMELWSWPRCGCDLEYNKHLLNFYIEASKWQFDCEIIDKDPLSQICERFYNSSDFKLCSKNLEEIWEKDTTQSNIFPNIFRRG